MKKVGKILNETRLKKGISIEHLSQELKISREHLFAIENGDSKNTPGHPYTLSFIKSFSNYLNLDTKHIVEIYKNEEPSKNNLKNVKINKFAIIDQKNYISISVTSFLILLFIFIFYKFFVANIYMDNDYAKVPELDPEIAALLEEQNVKKSLEELRIAKKNTEITIVEAVEEDKNIKINPKDAIANISEDLIEQAKKTIVLKIIGDTWMQIKDDKDNVILSKLMKKNESFVIPNSTNHFITTGNAGNIQIIINNKMKGVLGKKGEVLILFELRFENFN